MMKFWHATLLFVAFTLCSLKTYANDYAILVEKQSHKLNVLEFDQSGSISLVKTYPSITGKEQGNKISSGDKKTPEGIYFVTHTRTKEELLQIYGKMAEKYGPKAFVLNYPNVFDAQKNKTGSGIWVHGVIDEERVLKPFDTEGCVALSNKHIVELTDYIKHFATPVVIVDRLESKNIDKIFSGTPKYAAWLEEWRRSWAAGDFEQYQAYYSSKFQTNKKNKSAWIAYKRQIAENTEKKISIQIENPKVIEFKDQVVITFTQKYTSPLTNDEGRKFLYLQKEDDYFKILAEDFYPSTIWN